MAFLLGLVIGAALGVIAALSLLALALTRS